VSGAGQASSVRLIDAADLRWVDELIDDAVALEGRPWRRLVTRWQERGVAMGPRQIAVVSALRRTLSGSPARGGGRRVRRMLLGVPALAAAERAARIAAVAAAIGCAAEEVEARMWSDLPGERWVTLPEGRPTAAVIAGLANVAIVQRALARAFEVTVVMRGNARAVVRAAALAGLMFGAERRGEATVVRISGPLAIFGDTRVYGRALGALVAPLGGCAGFALEARVGDRVGGGAVVRLQGPVLLPATATRRFDSGVEARFARAWTRAKTGWRIEREPEVVAAGAHVVFPDFALVHELDPSRRWWVEIVGFWTASYLTEKLARYRAAGLGRLILCVDAARQLRDEEVPAGARVVRYRRSVEVAAVRAIVEGEA
jgi:predicted nuclease of restriction endonuclease-like RecB superfamily